MKKSKPKFVQTFKNVSPIFVIKNNKNKKRFVRDIKINEMKAVDSVVQVEFSTPELDAYDLRTLVFLLANINIDKENLQVLEALDSIDIINSLAFKLQPLRKGSFSKIIVYETNWSKLLSLLGLKYHPDNIGKVKESLKYLQMSVVNLKVKDDKGKVKLEMSSSLLLFKADKLPESRRNNKIVFILNPLFYLVAFGQTILKSTINLDVFRSLFEIDANMVIVYYVLCDKVGFGREEEFTISDLELACYGNLSDDRRTRSKRRKFLLRTLGEIERLSNGSFIIKIEKDVISVKRLPDRKINR
jgi:hypothetical protein